MHYETFAKYCNTNYVIVVVMYKYIMLKGGDGG